MKSLIKLLVLLIIPVSVFAQSKVFQGSGYVYDPIDGVLRDTRHLYGNVAAGTTDGTLTEQETGATLAATSGKRLCVISVIGMAGGTATNVTFNSKGSGAGTAISPTFAFGANGGMAPPYNPHCLFVTNESESLTVTTGAGSTVGISAVFVEIE